MMKSPKYKENDVVGVCGDAMYEFKILGWVEEHKVYNAECVSSYTDTIKVGDQYALKPSQIVVKLK